MATQKNITIAVTLILIVAVFYFIDNHTNISAEISTTHHQHGNAHSDIVVKLETSPKSIKAQTPSALVFYIKDSEGKPVQELAITHERLLHVIIVSEDFSIFNHVHPEDFSTITPEMKRESRYPIRYTFPKAGRYIVAVDSAVKGRHFSKHFFINVDGELKMDPFKKDLSREKNFGDYQVILSDSPVGLTSGEKTVLKYIIKKDGNPVTDLEPYLAAPMHIAIISTDLDNFIHAHGEVAGSSSPHHPIAHIHGIAHGHFGPDIEAHIVFPRKGLYQIFSEVKHRGRVIVFAFTVEVE